MDDLLNIATKTMEGFNPATDKVDDYEEVADGKYDCLLEKVTARKSDKSGNEWISFDFSQVNTDDNRHIFVSYFFTEKTIERSIKALTKLAYEFGYELQPAHFTDLETLADALNQMAGNQAIVEKKTSNSGFVNYKVTPTLD